MKLKRFSGDMLLITVGAFVYAFGIVMFLDPNELTPAGVSGLALVISRLLGRSFITTGAIIVLMNVPIMLVGIWKLGFKFFVSTIIATALSSVFIDLLQLYGKPLTEDLMLASVLGGVFMSLGMGLVFRGGATTGGSDVIVRVLRTKFRHIKTGVLFWFIDGAVVLISALVFGKAEVLLYAIVTLTVQTVVLDGVLYGSDSAKLVYIVSDKQKEISSYLLIRLGAGVTLINGTGAFTGDEKKVVMCVVKRKQLPLVRSFVCETDPTAFMIVTKATEIFGEGFKAHTDDDI